MIYYPQKPSTDEYLNPFGPKGYFDLTSNTECIKIPPPTEYRNSMKSSILGSTYEDRYCIQLSTSNENLTINLSWTNQSEMLEWFIDIQNAIQGMNHIVEELNPLNIANQLILFNNNNKRSKNNFLSLEMPRKVGVLKKRSVEGKIFGFRNVKTR
jgi:hypothetical protein